MYRKIFGMEYVLILYSCSVKASDITVNFSVIEIDAFVHDGFVCRKHANQVNNNMTHHNQFAISALGIVLISEVVLSSGKPP